MTQIPPMNSGKSTAIDASTPSTAALPPRAAPPVTPRRLGKLAGSFERIAVFRALNWGDLLCAVPALRALRAAAPRARITLVGLPWAREFADRFAHYIDDFLVFPGTPGLPERRASAREYDEFVSQASRARFDLAIQLHGSGRHSNSVVAKLKARVTAGFHALGEACPDPQTFLSYPEQEPEVRRLLRLTEFLGISSRGETLEFPITAGEWRALAELRKRYGLRPGMYTCIHPGAKAPARRWAPERFARVADRLAAKGWQIVLTGTAEEAPLTHAVLRAMHGSAIDLAGQTSIGVTGALLTGAKLLVCNDTGVSHVADALKVPSVVIYLASSPQRWAPLDRERHRRVFHDVDCRPCEHINCPIGHTCADGVSHDDVMREAEKLL